jgi:GTPase SAR1 family protein
MSSRGPLKFSVWDIGENQADPGLRDGYLVGTQAAIIMFDLTSASSYAMLLYICVLAITLQARSDPFWSMV